MECGRRPATVGGNSRMGKKFYGSGSLYRKSRGSKKAKNLVHYGNWLIKYKDSRTGKLAYFNLGTQDKSDAETLFAEWLLTRKTGDSSVLDGDLTVSEFFQNYLTRRERNQRDLGDIRPQSMVRYRNVLSPVIKFFGPEGKYGNLTMRELTGEHWNEYLRARLNQTRFNGKSKVRLTKEGIRREWRFIGGILRKANRDRVLLKDITADVTKLKVAAKVKILPGRDQIVEVRDLIEELEIREFVTVDMLCGARFNELAHMKFEDIDFGAGTMKIVPDEEGENDLKNPESMRIIDMPKEMEAVFRAIRDRRQGEGDDAYVFVDSEGRPFHEYPNLVYRRLTKALRKANRERKKNGNKLIPYFTVHTLRHWFISWALTRRENPLTEAELIKIVGHADFATTRKVYLHITADGDTSRKMRETLLFGDVAS